jgi:hypothetical protein
MYRNLKIKNTGLFYESSKAPQEGFVEVQTKTGGKVYHKYYPTIKGKLRGIYLDKKDWGEILSISLQDEENPTLIISLDLPVFSSGERVDDYTKSLVQHMENLVIGDHYSFGLNRTKTDSKGYLYKTFYIRNYTDELVKWGFEIKDVPKAVSNTSKVTGKTTWDFSEQDAFYYQELKRLVELFKNGGSPAAGGVSAPQKEVELPKELQDLPF